MTVAEKQTAVKPGKDHHEFSQTNDGVHRHSDDTATPHTGLEPGSERRIAIEKRLKRKLDARFSILVRPLLDITC